MAVFWIVAPCSLVEIYLRFRGTCCTLHQGCENVRGLFIALIMEAASTSETSINFYQTTRRYNPEDSRLHTLRRENLKSYLIFELQFLPQENTCFHYEEKCVDFV
jgi:hypothetical protein